MRYELWLALRFLFAKRRERFISLVAALAVGGVALGVAALIVVLAVMTGFDHDLTEKLVSVNAHLVVEGPQGVVPSDTILRDISAADHVVGVTPFVAGQAILRTTEKAFGVLVRGVDLERDRRASRLTESVVLGRMPQDEDECLIGTEMSLSLGAKVGDELTLLSPADGKEHELRISGLFRSGMYEYDVNLVAVPLARAQQLYRLTDVVTGLAVRVDEMGHVPAVRDALEARLGPMLTVKTWIDLNPALFAALHVEKVVMFVILSLIVVVAALNIVAMLIMIVMEKTKDIGILRALGATPGGVARLFLLQGFTVGVIGIGLGLAGGLALAANLNPFAGWLEREFGISVFPPTVYYLDRIPAQVQGPDVAAVGGAALVLTLLAGTYAAVRAARLAPVDALRYE